MHIPAPLHPLFEEGLVHEVIRPLMSGKEASVYLVAFEGHELVAKVYKDAKNRTFRQRAAYAEGRQVRNSRERRALAKGTGFGKARLEDNWQNAEVDALHRLHEAGVRVPQPLHHSENVLLMELVCDADGEPAPRLYDLKFTPDEARSLHAQLIREVTRMLCAGLVHGDLSEYNVLMSPEGPVIIDLPQTTDAATNNNAERLFLRDVDNLSRFLGRWAPDLRKTRYGAEIWSLYARAELTPDTELTGRHVSAKPGRVDTRDALIEIREAEADAPRPMSAYALKKQRRAEAARAEAAAAAKQSREPKPRGGDTKNGGPPPRGRRRRGGRGRGRRPSPR